MKKALPVVSMLLLLLTSCGELNDSEKIIRIAEKDMVEYLKSQGGYWGSGFSPRTKDFNKDGKTDVLIHLAKSSELCTFEGCPLLVYENEGRKLRRIAAIRNVKEYLGQRDSESGWSTFLVTSGDLEKQAEGAKDPRSQYELVYEDGYPEDATQGRHIRTAEIFSDYL
ncbi:MAG: hypothetical protein AAF716_13165 [Cyanobacteria bacterium P01_D01_bin.1]